MESHSNSFSSVLITRTLTLVHRSRVYGLKTSNTANVVMHDPVSIAGPINLWWGCDLREDLSSSLSGADILVKGRGDLER